MMMDIQTWEFFVYDDKTGEIKDRIFAHCKSTDHLPDRLRTERIVLKHVNGKLDNNLYFPPDTSICRSDCFIDPSTEQTYKIKEGAEDEFEFFMKHGYHKTGSHND
tara:strand:- start:5118 stop:5435 length:318 start_codon:yes stop_codon:yes gene_type:complete